MKLSIALIAMVAVFGLTACEMPNIEGLNSMPKKTQEMSEKMDKTNDAIHKQTLVAALDQMDKMENQAWVSPIPTGFMAAAKVFAEEATASELVEFTYLRVRELEEVNPATGLDADGATLNYTEQDKTRVRLQKMARLYGIMTIAGFVQDGKLEEIIRHDIQGNSRFQDAALNLLALRAAFIRDVMLAQSLNIRSDSPKILNNSGMMNEALKYLHKLEKISRLPFASEVKVSINEKQYNLISFEEKQDLEGQKATAKMWQTALSKATEGAVAYQQKNWTSDDAVNTASTRAEVAAQNQAMNIMRSYVQGWAPVLQ